MTNNEAIGILAIVVETAKGRCFVTDEAISEAYAMAISALQAQDSPKPTAESVQNVQNEDLILRKAAIDALKNERSDWNCDYNVPVDHCIDAIYSVPSAQPEPCDDAVSREAAIDVAENAFVRGLLASPDIRKLPSVQPVPCEDAVSRDSVKFLLCKETCHPGAFCPDGFCKEICEKVDALPSATPKQRMGEWIPVSERLPESKYEDLEYPTVIVCCGDGAVTLACYYESTKEWGTGEYYDRIINPVAWMPLPEPYRAERRTDGTD